jgi:2-polyprenyl-3-methyl-5-hydroxy-6-metoxy-1,4-benzoquinol methylase
MNINCRICGSETIGQRWGGSVCISCGSVSVTDLPSSDELEHYYLKFNQDYHGGGRAGGAQARQRRYAQAYLKPILGLNSGKRLLDIGSSTNPFPNIAVAYGYDVTVIDYIKPADLDSRVRFIQGSVEDANVLKELGDLGFDLVTAFAVIEHCRNPKLMAEYMVKLCSEKGYIIIATPLVNSFSERNALGKSTWFYPPEHIHLLSTEGMTRMFHALNCMLISARRYELNSLRWFLRYGLAYVEGLKGFIVKKLLPRQWVQVRDCRTSKVQELIYYVFEKR